MSRWKSSCCCSLHIMKYLINRENAIHNENVKGNHSVCLHFMSQTNKPFISLHVCWQSQQLVKRNICQSVPVLNSAKDKEFEQTCTDSSMLKSLSVVLISTRNSLSSSENAMGSFSKKEDNFQDYTMLQDNLFHCSCLSAEGAGKGAC